MLSGLLSELRILQRPLVLWVALGAVALAISFVAMSQEPNHSYINNLQQGEINAHRQRPSASDLGVRPGKPYAAALEELHRLMHRETADASARAEVVGSTQRPAGALGFSARLMASSIGALILCLLAGAHTGGEWSLKTIKDVLIRNPRRARFVVLKIAAIWTTGVGLVGCMWLGLIIFGLLARHIWPLPQPASSATTWLWALRQLLRSLPVLLLYSTIGVCISVVVRTTVGALFGCLIFLVACGFASRLDVLERVVPVVWIGSWMRYSPDAAPTSYLLDHPLSASQSLLVSPAVSLLAIAGLSGALALVAIATMKARRDVLL